jgi:DNA protecting protein DprA
MDWPLKKRGGKTGPYQKGPGSGVRLRYRPPENVQAISLRALLSRIGQEHLPPKQLDLLRSPSEGGSLKDVIIHFSGDLSLLDRPTVAIVGTREVSVEGRARTRRLAKDLAVAGVTVMSGLAQGVDTEAHRSAIAYGGRTAAVIGTPLSKAYPAENAELQEDVYQHHLLLSPFAEGQQVFKSNFPKRNRVMAALSAATVIIEASDTSGTLHQAAECQRLGRWLFIAKAVTENPMLSWPSKFLGKPRTAVLSDAGDVLAAISNAKS